MQIERIKVFNNIEEQENCATDLYSISPAGRSSLTLEKKETTAPFQEHHSKDIERIHLSSQEAFFLSWGLDCVTFHSEDEVKYTFP